MIIYLDSAQRWSRVSFYKRENTFVTLHTLYVNSTRTTWGDRGSNKRVCAYDSRTGRCDGQNKSNCHECACAVFTFGGEHHEHRGLGVESEIHFSLHWPSVNLEFFFFRIPDALFIQTIAIRRDYLLRNRIEYAFDLLVVR